MTKENVQVMLAHVSREVGLQKCPRCYRDFRFVISMFAGVPVLWFIHSWMPVFSSSTAFHWQLLISILIWQPFIEELLFRGVIQGQLSKYIWGQQVFLKISAANIATSILFVAVHMLETPPLWALAILIPSLLFGYFRDAFNSVYPSILLHSVYNAFVVIGLLINGNLII